MKHDNSNLDFLRAFAVLLVVFGHSLHYFGVDKVGPFDLMTLGTLGVMFFFVHTCLVLMLSLERQREVQGNNKLFLPFMIRRCFRIYPLSMVIILLIVVFGLPMAEISKGAFTGWHADFGDVLSNLFLVQNLSYRVSILGPVWSLVYEMEMYLLLPALFLIVAVKRVWWLVPTLLVASLMINWAVKFSTPNLLNYVPCFLPGVLAFMIQKKVVARVFAWPAFVVALAVSFSLGHPTAYRRYAVCLVLGLAIPFFRSIKNGILTQVSKTIAKYSYGIYLSHFVCIYLAFQKLSFLPIGLRVLIFLLSTSLISIFLFHAIENPFLKFGKAIADKVNTPILGRERLTA